MYASSLVKTTIQIGSLVIFIISSIQLVDLKKKEYFYFSLKAKEIQSTIRKILLEYNI
jgi:hypothetical protein